LSPSNVLPKVASTPACALFGPEEADRFVGRDAEIEALAKRTLR
jgi:hypothetical protein